MHGLHIRDGGKLVLTKSHSRGVRNRDDRGIVTSFRAPPPSYLHVESHAGGARNLFYATASPAVAAVITSSRNTAVA